MPLFDFCIRPVGTPPPLTMPFVLGGRVSAMLLFHTWLILSHHVYYFRRYGWTAFWFYTVIVYNGVTLPLDGLLSNSLGRNIENLRRAGYTDVVVWTIMNVNLVASQLLGFVVVKVLVINPDIYTWTWLCNHLDLYLLGRVVLCLTLSEVLFCASHSLLHRHERLSQLHVFHHCCTHPTWTTNVLFHPLDLALEFGGPALGLLGLHVCVFQDETTLLVTYLVFQLWYAYDHDEHLNFHHKQHHERCDALYVIYSHVKGDPRHNQLQRQIRAMDLQWPYSTKRSDVKEG